MSDALLTTKLLIPYTRPELVDRSRLIGQLRDGLPRSLTLISAPAGFGKTTLAAEWLDRLCEDPPRDCAIQIAWLSLDETDNDIKRFLTYFFAAVSRLDVLDPKVADAVNGMLQSPNPPQLETFFSPLINGLSSTKKKVIIALDDYHLIDDLLIHKALNFWLENVPSQVHTVVITREDPPFPLVRLRARDQLTELRAADLRFTRAESTQFLNEIMGLHLDAGSVALLEGRTEGWIAGLQMAALSMRNREDTVGFIETFSGTNRYILDYLLEEVLASQLPEIQQFLLHTAILRRLSAPLCDALLQGDQSATILAYLEQANLFLIPLDDERSWYRYHHLFSDLLNSRLNQTRRDEEIAGLHTRAAEWYENNGMSFGAIYHASLIPDDAWVERIIDQNYMEIFQRRDSASIRHWTGELGKDLIFKRPQLAIHEANSRAWFGQLDEADHLLDEAGKRLQAEVRTPEIDAMFGYLAYVKSRVTAMRGDFEGAIELCLKARENTPENNPGLLGGIGVMLGYGYFLNGDFDQAVADLEETIRTGKIFGAINTTIGAYCVLGRLFAIQGRLQKAHDLYQEAENFIRQSDGEHKGAMSIVNVGLAEMLYEWGDLESALRQIQRGLESIPLWSKADDIAMSHIIYAQIERARGNLSGAEKHIAMGAQVIHSSGVFPEARDAVRAAEVGLLIESGDSLAINRWVSAVEKRLTADDPFRFENELVLITLARLYLSRQEFDRSLDLLYHLEDSAQAGGRAGRLVKILILQALAMHAGGENAGAFSTLEKALALAEQEGCVRTFLDEGEPIRRLLSDWLSHTDGSPLRTYASHLAAQFDPIARSQPDGLLISTPEGRLVEPLSPREIEVLHLIALGKTNKEISAELVVSPGTVKAHTSNIYRKLDVSNRTEAVARARELDLLP